jgi:hypothetical protein
VSSRARSVAIPPRVAPRIEVAPSIPQTPVSPVTASPAPVAVAPRTASPARASHASGADAVAQLATIHVAGALPAATSVPDPNVNGGLGDELALLRGARAAIRAHDGGAALALLDQHEARFPNGMLREEREATHVLALCEIGRAADAHEAAQRFFETYPHSPHGARVRASCAGETP